MYSGVTVGTGVSVAVDAVSKTAGANNCATGVGVSVPFGGGEAVGPGVGENMDVGGTGVAVETVSKTAGAKNRPAGVGVSVPPAGGGVGDGGSAVVLFDSTADCDLASSVIINNTPHSNIASPPR